MAKASKKTSTSLTQNDHKVIAASLEIAANPEPAVAVTKSITCPAGSKETALYIITPVIGGKPRWFEKARMTSITKSEEGIFTLEMPVRAYNDRKMD